MGRSRFFFNHLSQEKGNPKWQCYFMSFFFKVQISDAVICSKKKKKKKGAYQNSEAPTFTPGFSVNSGWPWTRHPLSLSFHKLKIFFFKSSPEFVPALIFYEYLQTRYYCRILYAVLESKLIMLFSKMIIVGFFFSSWWDQQLGRHLFQTLLIGHMNSTITVDLWSFAEDGEVFSSVLQKTQSDPPHGTQPYGNH